MKQGKLLLEWSGGETEDYDDFCVMLTAILHKKNADGFWYAKVNGFGWRGMSGSAYVEGRRGGTFLYRILPKTECTFKIFNYGKGIMIQNWHHDSCTGNEKYYCFPISNRTFDNKSYKGEMCNE
jgi:hypothetical protein